MSGCGILWVLEWIVGMQWAALVVGDLVGDTIALGPQMHLGMLQELPFATLVVIPSASVQAALGCYPMLSEKQAVGEARDLVLDYPDTG